MSRPSQKSRYCQLLMLARKGQTLMLTAEDFACPAAKAAFGLAPLPEKIASGEMLCSLGLFMTKGAAAKTMRLIPRIKIGETKAVIAGPLKDLPVAPDVVLVEGLPEQVMWLCLARNFKGGRLNFSSSIFQCCCVDVTVVPYLTGEVNISPGCYGCREATDTPPEHMFMGIPSMLLTEVVNSLQFLSKRLCQQLEKNACTRLIWRPIGNSVMSEDFIELLFADFLVKKIEIKEISPCTADPERIKFLAQADKPLEDVLPILYLAI
ncbi:MAG: DUF169 domain-containing protein, partial [Candidatus Bathyarchaeia archaeon]